MDSNARINKKNIKVKITSAALILCFAKIGYAQEINPSISKNSITDGILKHNKLLAIETLDGNLIKGKLVAINNQNKKIGLFNSKDTIWISFKSIQNIHDYDKKETTDIWNYSEAPIKMFYTPMGKTLEQGRIAFENNLLISGMMKVGITDKIEGGLGITLAGKQNNDSLVGTYFMGSLKYNIISKKRFNMSLGAFSGQIPPSFLQFSGTLRRPPFFNLIYVAADYEYKFTAFSFSVGQPYYNSIPMRIFSYGRTYDERIDYMASANVSFKMFPFLSVISENIFFRGAWGTGGNFNFVNNSRGFLPMVGARYYGPYYSAGLGITNFLISNTFMIYVGGTYYF